MRRHFLVLFTALMALTSLTVQAQYSVYMTSYGDSKINVIKAVREFRTDLGLAEAKTLVESVPCFVLEGVSYSEASTALESLTTAGATAEIVEGSTPPTPSDNHEYGSFNALYLSNFGTGKLAVVKAVRVATGMGLADANSLVSSVPTMIYNVLNESQTANLIHTLDSVGAAYSVYQAGYCNEGQTLEWYRSPAGKVTIRGTGAMYDYDRLKYGEFQSPWTSNGDTSDYGEDFSYAIEELAVEEGVTSIGSWAFAFCDQLTTITLPSTLTSIGEGAFQYCDELTTIYANSALDNMSTNAFGDWYNRSNITVYASDAETYGFWRDNGFNVVRDYEDPNAMTIYLQVTDEGNSLYAIENDYLTVSAWLGEEEGCVGSMEFGYDYEIGSYIKLTIYPDDLANAATVAGRTLRFMIYYFGNEGLASNETPTLPVDGEFWIHPSCVKLNGTQATITYQQGATYGSPSNPIELEYVHLNQLSLPAVIEATVGETILLNDLLTYSPSNASIPTYDPMWEMSETECIMLGEDEESHPTLEVLSLPEGDVWIKANYEYVESSRANIVITDPNAFVLWATLTVDGQPLGVSQKFVPAAKFCEIQAFAGFSQLGEDATAIITEYDESYSYTSLYRIYIPSSEYYVGKTLSFVLNSHTDNLGGITSPMPSDGRYLIRDIKDNTGKISAPIVYQPGTTLGSVEEPYNLNYVTPTSVNVFQPYTATVGDIFSVEDLFDVTPSNASLLFPINWNLDENPFVLRTEENMLEAVSPSGETGPSVNIFMGDDFSTTFQAPIVVNDPTGCTYYVTVTVNHESIPVQWGIPSDYDYIHVIPYLNGEAISDPIGCKRVETASTLTEAGSVKCIYAVRIDASQYAGQTIEFHVTTHYDESIIGYSNEIEANALPLSGEYIIRDVSWENYASASRMPVNAGTVYGSANNPIDLCYITPEEVSTTPSAIDLTVDGTFNLSTLTFDFLPANCSVPVEFEPSWGIGDVASNYLSLSSATPGNEPTILKGLAATEGSLNINGYTDEISFQVPVTVSEPAIAITGIQATTTETQILWANGEWNEGGQVLPLDDLYVITPADASNQEVTWSTSNDCVMLSDSGNEFGAWYAYTNKLGKGVLTVTTIDGSYTASINFEVRNHVEGLSIVEEEIELSAGTSTHISENWFGIYPEDAYDKSVEYSLCDTSRCVTLEQKNGTWQIVAHYSGVNTLRIQSIENPEAETYILFIVTTGVTGIQATTEETQILWSNGEQEEQYLVLDDLYSIIPANADNPNVTWESSNSDVVYIWGHSNEFGSDMARANEVGTATLTVTSEDGGYTADINVEVRAHVEGIEPGDAEELTISAGVVTPLPEPSIFPDNAYDKSVTWAVGKGDRQNVTFTNNNGIWSVVVTEPGFYTFDVTSVDNPNANFMYSITVNANVTGIQATTTETQILWANGEWNEGGQVLPLDDLYVITPADASNQEVTWSTSNDCVMLSDSGNEFGAWYAYTNKLGKGVLTVTTVEGGYTASINFEVRNHVESIELSQYEFNMQRGVPFDMSSYVSVVPSDAYNKAVRWECEADVATISGNTITPKVTGEFILNVVSAENPNISNECTVYVTAPAAGVYAVNPVQELWIGENADLSIYFEPADATSTVKSWTSSNTNVVAISLMEAGYTATAKAAGTATLTVTTDNGQTATIEVTVKSHVESLQLSEQALTVAKGSTTVLDSYLTVLPADAYDKSVTWAVTDTATVVTVSQDKSTGKWQFKANRSGSTTLKVTSNDNQQAFAFLTVDVESHVTGVWTTDETQVLWVGDKLLLNDLYRIIPADAINQNVIWSSSNEDVIAYGGQNKKEGYYAIAKGVGTATLTVTTAEGRHKGTINVEVRAHVESITLSEQALTVAKGSTTVLDSYLTVLPANAYDKSVTWAVSDTATVVTVSQDKATGKWQFKANRSGSTTLKVTSNDNPQAFAFLTVNVESHVTGIKTTSETQVLWVGDILPLDDLYTIIPADAANQNVTWTSSNAKVISYEGESNEYGGAYAQAVGAGTAKLTVTTAEGGYKGTVNVEVRAHVESITLSQQALTLQRGSTADLAQYVTVLPANAFDKTVTWKSADETIASVTGNTAIAKALGTTTLTVSSAENPKITASLTVTVEAAAAGVYAVNPVQTIAVGEKADLSIFFEPVDATSAVKSWTSSNTNVITISGNGTTAAFAATAKAPGKATLTVTTDNGQTATIEVTVYGYLEEITLSVSEVTLEKGETLDLSKLITTEPATGLYDLTIKYLPKEGSEHYFTVDNNGKVTALESTCGDSYEVEILVSDGFGNAASAVINIGVTVTPTDIHLEAATQSILVGGELNLGYTVLPEGADLPADEKWSSSNKKVVSVALTEEGWKAYAEGVGQATVTLTLGDLQATINVEVYSIVERILLNTQGEQINQGETICLDDFIVGFEPEDAADKRVIWKAEDEKIVTITQKDGKYYATGLAEGSTSLMVQSVANPEVASYMSLFVRTAIVSITALYPEQYVFTDTYVDLSVEILPAEAADRYVDWTCSDPEAMTFYADPYTGKYMPQFSKYGDFTLTGTPDEGEHTCTITVHVVKHVEEITLTATEPITLEIGQSQSLDDLFTIIPDDAYNKDVIWTSNDESVATVNGADGHWTVNGISSGITMLNVVSVDNPDAMARIEVSVIRRVTGITVEEPEQTLYPGDYVNTMYTILPEDADNMDVTFSISDEDILGFDKNEIDNFSCLKALRPGEATVTITTDDGEYTATITVHVVKHVEEITLTTTERLTLEIGQSQSLDDLFTIIPDDAYNKDVIWTSNDESVATVNGADGHWTVNGISSGITMLNVVSVDNPDAMARIEVSVIRRVTGITVEEPEQTLYPGDYVNTMYTILPEDADNMDVTFSISDEDILGFDKNEIDNFSCLKALRPGEATVTITTDEGGYTATIHVTVATAIEEIMLSTDTISLDINETVDLNDYITAILPEDALDKSVYWTIGWVPDTYMTIAEDGHTATTLKETREPFQISVHAQSGYAYKHVWVEIYCHPKRIVVDQSEQAVELNEAINLGYKVLPEGARYNPDDIVWVSSDQSIVHVGHDAYMTHMTEEICAVAKKPGTATLTVSLPKENLSATISVTVNAPTVESIYCDWPDIMKGESTSVSVYSSPEYSIIDPEKLEISLVDDYGTWKPFTYALTTDEEGNAAIEVEALTWGQYRMQLDYPGTKGNAIWMYFGQPINLEKGWNWVSLANATYPIEGIKNISLAFDNKLIDARTIDDALYLDPTYGLFGTLTTFQGGSYKMEVSDNVCLQNHKVEYDINSGFTTTLHEGWNWITYPYDQNYSLYELNTYGAFSTPVKGDRIVSKDGGFSEYGTYSWSGTLDQLNESEGYMYYTSESHSIQWPAPSQLGQKDAYGYKATSRRTLVDTNDIWQYDHRLFADNMTIIATVKGLDFPDDCTIGAFVDGTCRGMGTYVDGKFFITVHGKVGESVTFVIHDDATDSYYNVPGSLSFDNMIGSLDHPLPLKAGEKTTAIELRSTDIDDSSHSFYDLSGRRLISPATGVYIQDGKLIYIK